MRLWAALVIRSGVATTSPKRFATWSPATARWLSGPKVAVARQACACAEVLYPSSCAIKGQLYADLGELCGQCLRSSAQPFPESGASVFVDQQPAAGTAAAGAGRGMWREWALSAMCRALANYDVCRGRQHALTASVLKKMESIAKVI